MQRKQLAADCGTRWRPTTAAENAELKVALSRVQDIEHLKTAVLNKSRPEQEVKKAADDAVEIAKAADRDVSLAILSEVAQSKRRS